MNDIIRKTIHCPKCGHQHIDLDEKVEVVIDGVGQGRFKNFGVEPHRNHTCLSCLHTFPDFDNEKSIGV